MNLKLIKILPLFLLISGCVSNAQIDKMNNGTNAALGKPLTGLINVIGDPHETIQIGDRQRLTWITPHNIRPCKLIVFIDNKGIMRRTGWDGYVGACKIFGDKLTEYAKTQN
tara:strand:+ start:317 stop:652 length:336 start_codon:yes stop_codon:yes gene_type:complete